MISEKHVLILFWILDRKENKVVGIICFEIQIPCKTQIHYAISLYKLQKTEVKAFGSYGMSFDWSAFGSVLNLTQ